MNASVPLWSMAVLTVIILIAIIPVLRALRAWRGRPHLTADESSEAAAAPLTRLQKHAWFSLGAGVLTLAVISALISTYGAAEYWHNDSFRLTVVGIFIAGLAACATLLTTSAGGLHAARLDERDRQVLSKGGAFQTALIVISLAIWLIALGEKFHDDGAVPMVYLNLIFGSTVLMTFIGQSLGILVGYWLGERLGQA